MTSMKQPTAVRVIDVLVALVESGALVVLIAMDFQYTFAVSSIKLTAAVLSMPAAALTNRFLPVSSQPR